MLLNMLGVILMSAAARHSGIGLISSALLVVLFFSVFPNVKNYCDQKTLSDRNVHKIKASNPTDISTVCDGISGIYVFWRESRSSVENKILYAYIDFAKEHLEEITGKKIIEMSFIQKSPASISYVSNDAVVAWKDYSIQPYGEIFMQRISGERFVWDEGGIRINNTSGQIIDYSFCSDKSGNIFVCYTTRSDYPSNDYNINYQRVLSDGSLAYKNQSIIVEASPRMKNNIKVLHDNNGGAFILWTEKINNIESLLIKKCDPAGKSVLGKRPIKISSTLQNVTSFTASIISKSLLYIAWETDNKNIYHQLIKSNGQALWTIGGVKAANTKGKNFFPQSIQDDSLITLSWLNDLRKHNTLYVQKFRTNGKSLWKDQGVAVLYQNDLITNYSIFKGDNGELLTACVISSDVNKSCGTSTQKISSKGKLLWDSSYTSTSLPLNCSNNYLSLFPRTNESIILTYNTEFGEIVIEKVQKFQKADADFIALKSEPLGQAIMLKINTNAKDENSSLIIERLFQSDTTENAWNYIGQVSGSSNISSAEYEFIDDPDEFGTLYYRAVLKNKDKDLVSNISRIDHLESVSRIVVAQNNPNPFRDSTVINFYLPISSSVGFEFFDEHAEKIGEITEREFPAGENSITFHSRGLQPGIYFYKLFTKGFVEVKKMVIE